MPIRDDQPLRDQIRHGEHLTMTDIMRAKFQPIAEQEGYLNQQAQQRKQEYDEEQRKKQSQPAGS